MNSGNNLLRPEAMSYYERILTSDFRFQELEDSEKKVIGVFCNFVPLEIIYALDCIPVRLCAGDFSAVRLGEEIYPRDICPLVKSSLGLFHAQEGLFKYCDLIILPAPCDAKKKMFEILKEEIPTVLLELPHENTIEHLGDFIWGIKKLVRELEKFCGVPLERKRLHRAIESVREVQEDFRELHSIRKNSPSPITGRDYMLVYQASFFDDLKRWARNTGVLCRELHRNNQMASKESGETRILLSGAPLIWPNFKLLDIIEEAGSKVVADELCSATRWLYDLVEVDEFSFEGMLEALCARYLLPSVCPCFLKSDNRTERLLALYKEFNCDGIIYHSLRLCQLHDIDSVKIKKLLKGKDIPFLQIYTDYSQEDQEQIKIRIEAFMEILKKR